MTKVWILFLSIFNALLWSASAIAADKNIGVLVFDGVLTSDVTAPVEVFGMASRHSWFSDYNVITINVHEGEHITTNEGLIVQTQSNIRSTPDLDVLVLPSSYEMDELLENPALIAFIKRVSQSADWMASHCSGALLLAKAGLLDGKKATTWAGGEDAFQSDFPAVNVVFDQNWVLDGKVMTSNGGVVAYEASLALLEQMTSAYKAKEVAEALQFNRVLPHRFSSKTTQALGSNRPTR